ncbi:MAG: hypothetical protein JW818_16005 [Pirellulales bacterium]|nr:hypothetical protein [Pirellulales bacterium]
MDQIQVLLAVDSLMLGELLRRTIEREADLVVVGQVDNPIDLLVAVGAMEPDVVLHTWPDSDEMPGVFSHLLTEYPDLVVIGLPSAADRAVSCRQVIQRTETAVSSIKDLLAEIRTAADSLRLHA